MSAKYSKLLNKMKATKKEKDLFNYFSDQLRLAIKQNWHGKGLKETMIDMQDGQDRF